MSEIKNEATIARIQSNLDQLVDKAENCISSNSDCDGVCESLPRNREDRTDEQQRLWNECGCR